MLVLHDGAADDAAPTLWIDVDPGIRIEVRRLEVPISEAAANVARKLGAKLTAEAEEAAKAGMPMDEDGPTPANPAWVQAQVLHAQISSLARFGIVSWEGVVDTRGAPLPVTAATCDALARHPNAGLAFFNRYWGTLDAQVAEGNGSAKASDGGSAAAPSTAGDAPDATADVPAADAAPQP